MKTIWEGWKTFNAFMFHSGLSYTIVSILFIILTYLAINYITKIKDQQDTLIELQQEQNDLSKKQIKFLEKIYRKK
ncbi:hypothetical protein N9948_01820 [bacterium]|nr:hypothetical protein [bacterium]